MPKSNESSTSRAEQIVAESLLSILSTIETGDRLQESSDLQDVLSALEYFLPEVLGKFYQEWTHESLDGVFPLIAEKVGARAVQIFGHCIIITDQTIVPFLVELQVDSAGRKVTWIECNLGERDQNGMRRTPCQSPGERLMLLDSLDGQRDSIDWAYTVTYGERID